MAKQNQEQTKLNLEALLAAGIKEAEVEAWKKKHGDVVIITIHVAANDKALGVYAKPNRDVIANCVNQASAGQIFEAREFLAQNTWLGGDTRHQTNDDVAIPAQVELWKALNFLKAEVQKY